MKITKTAPAAAICAGLATTLFLITPAAAQNRNPGVLPPQSAPHGLTYGEWSARWFKWAYEQPAATSPVLDTTGANCAVGQSGKRQTARVWFLAGTFFTDPAQPPVPVVRTCSVPQGYMLFFPVGNGFCAAEPGGFAGNRACATGFATTLSGFAVEIDGISVTGLQASLESNPYRALSPEFTLDLPPGNIFAAPPGIYSPAAGDGVYLMLTPLPPGQHTIHIHADISGGGQLDVTYFLTVGK
jgi:hypothetical protein